MSRGGKRDNAGRKSGWVNLETKLIRVPVAIESQLMAIAKKLDQGEIIDLETKSIEIELVTESRIDSVTNSIKEIVQKYKQESDKTTLKNTRWDQARKLLGDLELVLYTETIIDSVTEIKTEVKELVTESESHINDLVTESKGYEVEQIELIPIVLQSSKLEPLSQPDLAIRLKVSVRAMRNHKNDFAEWSKSKDPDGVAWERHEDTKKYYPLN
jgi:hypothetical protein